MSELKSATVLVTGATGAQGGGVVRAALAGGATVRALVRDPDSASASALAAAGATLVTGDLDDEASLATALAGASAVFSVQPAALRDRDSERRQGRDLIDAARGAGVRQMVHTSVSATGWRELHPDVEVGLQRNYWSSKEDVESLVRDAGFDTYTILKPAFMMENFIAPKARGMFPDLTSGEIVTAVEPTTILAVVAVADIGAAAAAAIDAPESFSGAEIELAGDALTVPEIARAISEAAGRPVTARTLPKAEIEARHGRAAWAGMQVWLNEVGYPARPDVMSGYRLTPTSFGKWAAMHVAELRAATARPRT